MSKALRVLHLEDNANYSALVRAKLEAEGFAPDLICVETPEDFSAALGRGDYDLIIADYFLPHYDGITALKLAQEKQPNTPILLVSGTIGEEAAIQSLKAGATDYVLKHWPERLIPAVRRALREADERRSRVRAEAALLKKERYFQTISENSLDLVTILDREGCFSYNSLSVKHMLGYQPEELLGESAFAYIHPEDIQPVKTVFAEALRNPGASHTVLFRIQDQAGKWHCLEAICQSLIDDAEINGVVVNSRDVTERQRMELYNRVLSTLGLKLSSAISEEAAAEIIVKSADELFGWDACLLNLYFAKEDRVYPVLTMDTINGEKRPVPRHEIPESPSTVTRRVLARGAELILREEPIVVPAGTLLMGDKSRPSASLMYVPIRSRGAVIGIFSIQSYRFKAYDPEDLNTLQTLADYCGGALERIRVEAALRDSECRFRQLFEDSPDAVFVESTRGVVLDANIAAARLHGMRREELVGKNVTELVPASLRERVANEFELLERGQVRQLEGISLAADGREIPVEVRTSRIDYSGKPALLMHVRDISERKRSEEALLGSEVRFHSVWENSADGMRLTDENGIIVAVNQGFCDLVGIPREELEGQPFSVMYSPEEDWAMGMARYRERFATRTVEKRLQRKMVFRNGKVMDLEAAHSFIESKGQRTLLLGLFRDITTQKRLEEQLRQSQKMDAIGQLAGGVAHDFNNILTVIQGHGSLMRSSGELKGSLAVSAEQICQAAERAAGLTRQLLTFSRRQMMQPQQLDLNAVVSNMTKMLGRILGEDIALQFNYSPSVPLVHADTGMIEQILLNLAVNSRDSMPGGGQLVIHISIESFDSNSLGEHPESRTGEFACISVADKGTGIEASVLPHIFEPFFTTKSVGKGTGLGLATVYGIIKQHHGWVEVESEVGKGTTFKVYLPRLKEAVAPESAAAPKEAEARGGNETILVVEDEPPVRDLVCRILKAAGYQVLPAENGNAALKIWAQHKERIQLLLTDIVMPDGMTGRDLAEKIKAEKPALKAIFTSGYSADIVGKDFIIQEGTNFLQKPYVPPRLLRAIRNCLDGE